MHVIANMIIMYEVNICLITGLTVTSEFVSGQKVSNVALAVKRAILIDANLLTISIVNLAFVDVCELKHMTCEMKSCQLPVTRIFSLSKYFRMEIRKMDCFLCRIFDNTLSHVFSFGWLLKPGTEWNGTDYSVLFSSGFFALKPYSNSP